MAPPFLVDGMDKGTARRYIQLNIAWPLHMGSLVKIGSDDMKISARNVLKGRIIDVTKGATTAQVKIDIGGSVVTASITNAAVDDLKLAAGREAYAVIKASDVMVGVD
jgi:molybdopterin-binding protein